MIKLFARRRKDTLKTEHLFRRASHSSIFTRGRNGHREKITNMGGPQEAITEDEIVGMEVPNTKTNSRNACK